MCHFTQSAVGLRNSFRSRSTTHRAIVAKQRRLCARQLRTLRPRSARLRRAANARSRLLAAASRRVGVFT